MSYNRVDQLPATNEAEQLFLAKSVELAMPFEFSTSDIVIDVTEFLKEVNIFTVHQNFCQNKRTFERLENTFHLMYQQGYYDKRPESLLLTFMGIARYWDGCYGPNNAILKTGYPVHTSNLISVAGEILISKMMLSVPNYVLSALYVYRVCSAHEQAHDEALNVPPEEEHVTAEELRKEQQQEKLGKQWALKCCKLHLR